LQDLAETRAYDKLFFDTGVEKEDILYSSKQLDLDSNAEFKALME